MSTLSARRAFLRQGLPGARRISHGQMSRLITYAILLPIIIYYLYPFWWIISSSLKTSADFFARPLGLIPAAIQWGNYIDAWNKAQFSKYFFNTVYVCFFVVVGVNLVSGMAGYALARSNFPGKRILQAIIILTMFLPAGYTVLPVFQIMANLHLTNTREVLIILGIAGGSGFNTFLYWGYFNTLPKEMEEAAIMDGANFWQVFWQVMFPLASPMTGTVSLLTFLGTWNDFLTPLIFVLGKPENRTLAVGMFAFINENSRDWTLMLAATMITLLPIILVFLFLQRYFVEAISGSVK